ncbi:hypothetical protein PIROE2DRAFT_10658 [Piromyces sp. E2]|nr:hypothetical protein PIROE2DRAFT_10658 [Piromyces sp. E2]|eukprot:OUM62911.1 hypothetical protein PIROE2DRAFT_10658 [Piromyces sp. E2]
MKGYSCGTVCHTNVKDILENIIRIIFNYQYEIKDPVELITSIFNIFNEKNKIEKEKVNILFFDNNIFINRFYPLNKTYDGTSCNESGWCGKSDDYCGSGCQFKFSYCPGKPKSKCDFSKAVSRKIDKESIQYVQDMWDFLVEKIGNEYGVAGVMAYIYEESRLRPIDAEHLIFAEDEKYTINVNRGSYSRSKFISDEIGYGLMHWASRRHKSNLYENAKKLGVSIGNEKMQLNYLWNNIDSTLINDLKNAKSIRDAALRFMVECEEAKDLPSEKRILLSKNGRMFIEACVSASSAVSTTYYKVCCGPDFNNQKSDDGEYCSEYECYGILNNHCEKCDFSKAKSRKIDKESITICPKNVGFPCKEDWK